ncbi:MAG TPA: 3'(2'),5'-bisphosphate nucleotidase CysQ [Bacteroidales bacterium]|nr:3'(2'),5'-bisphosphate nucleotidase CysQ [Bacteroidales bacterium]
MKQSLDICLKAAFEAGKDIMHIYLHEDFNVEMKSDNSPLTKADKKAHETIMAHLKDIDYPVLSEEGKSMDYNLRKDYERFWLVDPLDGTKEFISRNGEFTVNIALIEHGTPVAGVIYVPVTGDLYLGIVGEGAWKQNLSGKESAPDTNTIKQNKNAIRCTSRVEDKLVVVGSRSHMNDETRDFISKLESTYGKADIMSRGSSLKLCMVAEGKAHVYPRFAPTMEWDTGAGHAIAKAAGAEVLDATKRTELNYNKADLLNPWFIVKPKGSEF